jgi:hypothetical protein
MEPASNNVTASKLVQRAATFANLGKQRFCMMRSPGTTDRLGGGTKPSEGAAQIVSEFRHYLPKDHGWGEVQADSEKHSAHGPLDQFATNVAPTEWEVLNFDINKNQDFSMHLSCFFSII